MTSQVSEEDVIERRWWITIDGEVLYYHDPAVTGGFLVPASFTPNDINQWLEERLKTGEKIRLWLPPKKVSWGFRSPRDYQVIAVLEVRRRHIEESQGQA